MKFETKTVRKTINKAFLKEPLERGSFTQFKDALEQLLADVELAKEKNEHEEHFKNFLVPFFRKIGFSDYSINTSGRIDMAIHTDGKGKDPVGVLIEAKRPGNAAEMITTKQLNRKAMHEAVLYYLEQRIEQDNSDLKHVIITNMDDWFIFDAQDFERFFYTPSALRKTWKEWKSDRKISSNNDFMYSEISKFMESQDVTLSGLWLPLDKTRKFLKGKKDSDYEKKLIPICKLFTPTHLLKEPFANDSNSLNREFYRELLYILGLEEVKEGSTRYIQRASEKNRNPGSVIENTIRILDAEDHLSTLKNELSSYGSSRDEQLFSVAMELSITWMNRVLFLKLLEAQLYRYHRQDKKFKFLNYRVIDSLDELNKLFFQVLARKENERLDDVNEKFGHIPYLNSSLFDVSSLERQTTRISGLDDHAEIPVYSRSVLSKERGNTINTLDYLFRFLEAYDFAAEGSEEIRDESKSLINASVLGLIFEKINGYRDGSFYTPGFITEYMARETLRKAVVDKFAGFLPSHQVSVSGVDSPSPPAPLPPAGEGGVGSGNGNRVEEPGWVLPESLVENARYLRQNQTEAEELLWQLLRNRQLFGYKFRRQHPVKPGFVLDFYCAAEKLAIEADGAIHDRTDQKLSDQERTQILNEQGIQVIRFRNEDILNKTEHVLKHISKELGVYSAHNPGVDPVPSPAGGRGVPEGRGEGGSRDGGAGAKLTFTDIYNRIGRDISIAEANNLINSITICDPAVGSGHFLVSCLNELLAIKSELGILCDTEGKVLRGVDIEVQNDELIISYGEELFEYDVSHQWNGQNLKSRNVAPDKQRIQKALFREKKYLIENCLFGVDINPNSVKICRLRLWIELLKRAYYQLPSPAGGRGAGGEGGNLEVLPNIDINIKQGNSLVSRFALDADLSTVFKNSEHSLEDYKEAVRSYKHTGDSTEKKRLYALIDDIKSEYSTTLYNNNPLNKKLSKERGRLELMHSDDLFGEVKFTKKQVTAQKKKVKKLEQQKADEESGAFYNQAFEWRFEFPEVLDDEGRFTGFDVVIGNPPYGVNLNSEEKDYLKTTYPSVRGNYDVYVAFFERGIQIGSLLNYIAPISWLTGKKFKPLRKFILDEGNLLRAIILPYDVFPEAYVDTGLYFLKTEKQSIETTEVFEFHPRDKIGLDELTSMTFKYLPKKYWANEQENELIFNPFFYELKNKMHDESVLLDDIAETVRGILAKKKDIDNVKKDNSKPLFVGNLYRYILDPDFKWLIYGDNLKEKPKDYSFFKGERILIRRLISRQFRMMATFVDEEFVNKKDIYNLKLKDDRFQYHYILALLNSRLFSFLKVGGSSLASKDDFSQLTLTDIRELPIKICTSDKQSELSDLAKSILSKKQNPEADTIALELEIDRLVYELYGLSEEEIGVVEGDN
ncbi:MAG: DUF559 domain-containing protein [Balneolaceae bacterium]